MISQLPTNYIVYSLSAACPTIAGHVSVVPAFSGPAFSAHPYRGYRRESVRMPVTNRPVCSNKTARRRITEFTETTPLRHCSFRIPAIFFES